MSLGLPHSLKGSSGVEERQDTMARLPGTRWVPEAGKVETRVMQRENQGGWVAPVPATSR